MTQPVPSPCPSPCVDVCRMDEASGLCVGCLRTLDEIAIWSVLDEADKHAVCAALVQRRARLPLATPASSSGPP